MRLKTSFSWVIEWCAHYSSQLSDNTCNNSIIIDTSGYVIAMKYNGVEKNILKTAEWYQKEQFIAVAVFEWPTLLDWFYTIDIDNNINYINWKLKLYDNLDYFNNLMKKLWNIE